MSSKIEVIDNRYETDQDKVDVKKKIITGEKKFYFRKKMII